MKLKVWGVICSGCGDTAGLITHARNLRYDVWLGHLRLCRCWDCLLDYLIVFDERGRFVTVIPEDTRDDFLSTAGQKQLETGDIPF